jgi:uncharacterized protein YbjT (DUF2867 family)
MSEKIAVILGSTGMIGTYLQNILLEDTYFDTVRILVRRPQRKTHPKLEVKLVNYDDAESVKLALDNSHAVFSCIGTTQKNVKGDKQLYRKIDFEIPAHCARWAKESGCEKWVMVTSVNANPDSSTFYLKLKGDLEEAVIKTGIESIHIMQPSMLLGERTEKRPLEKILQGSFRFLGGIFPGSWRKFKAIEGHTVAKAMLNAAKHEEKGIFRYTYDGITGLAKE